MDQGSDAARPPDPDVMIILLADDSPVMRKIYRTALEGLEPGPTSFVEAENSSQAAVLLGQSASLDLVIADWDLPGQSGPAFLNQVRAVRNIPVLFCINRDQVRQSEALPGGPVDFIQRPFADEALRAKVLALEAGSRERRTEESAAHLHKIVTKAEAEVDLPFFLQLPSQLMGEFITLASGTKYEAGATIFDRGTRVEALHVLTSGEAEVVDGLRKDLALSYLESGELQHTDIAFRLGFAHVEAFYRAFKRWTGQTPLAFRKSRSSRPPQPGLFPANGAG